MSPKDCSSGKFCPSAQPTALIVLRFARLLQLENCFYVDNCLQSVPTPEEAKQLGDRLQSNLSLAGFEL